ncbi:hypothetical protein [Burkholderia cepacia]|uniref:hypothetical protein n=1 Tax=Burkholderia cepacia TaxID=292 RepID=UPI001E4CAB85|nr:hypothetical protein [Burkholderia cepacia]
MQSIDTAYAVMQALDKECGVIGEPSLKFKSVEFSLPRKHHKFRATPHLQRSMRNARTVPAQLVPHLLHRWNTIFAPPIRRLLQQACVGSQKRWPLRTMQINDLAIFSANFPATMWQKR